MTSDNPQKHNLQIQVNKQTKVTSLKPVAPGTVSTVLAPSNPEMSASDLKKAFKENSKL